MLPTADYSESRLAELWQRALDPDARGLPIAIATDLSSFTGETVETVMERMARGMDDFKQQWERSAIDVRDPESVAAFYRDQIVEAYELAQWHCGLATGHVPLNYARAALFAQELGAKSILDFGCGIGSGSLALLATGAEVHSADIAQNLLRLTGHRLSRRSHSPVLIDLNGATKPRSHYYDLITCFDVLEHVPDQLATVRELAGYLKQGGRLIANFAEDSTHPERPMHISSAGNWIRLIRKTSLAPDWASSERIGLPVVIRKRLARLQNVAAVVLHGE
jgi:2-polyprenyl-3-methyl-5-hydroxy-6-metoxy-1,4-benzoquinol methylase